MSTPQVHLWEAGGRDLRWSSSACARAATSCDFLVAADCFEGPAARAGGGAGAVAVAVAVASAGASAGATAAIAIAIAIAVAVAAAVAIAVAVAVVDDKAGGLA